MVQGLEGHVGDFSLDPEGDGEPREGFKRRIRCFSFYFRNISS